MQALVTGASSGIGLAYSRELARMGHDVLLVSNQEEALNQAAADIEKEFGVKAIALYKDLTTPTACQEIYDFCQEHKMEVDILINDAGMFFFNYLTNVPMAKIEAMLSLHMLVPTRLIRLFAPGMQERRKGYILNMSSMTTDMIVPLIQCYDSTKAYLDHFSRSMWYELKPYGINVLSMTPGAVDTSLYNASEKVRKLSVKLGIALTPEQLAKRALRELFRGRKKQYMPGLCNHLGKPFYKHIPDWFVFWLAKKVQKFMK